MERVKLNIRRCKGCWLCISVCPKGVFSPSGEIGANGFGFVKAEPEKCIGCGACYRMCPEFVIEILDRTEGSDE